MPSGGLSQRRRDGCAECRRKKVKCDLVKPTCSRCTRYPRGCIYELGIITQNPKSYRSETLETATHSQGQGILSADGSIIPMVDAVTIASNMTHQPTLYLSPLLSTTESRFFMSMFSTETATRLFPAAPKLFIQRMISGALEKPHLFYALVAAACGHHSRLVQQDAHPRSKMMGLKYTTLAISHLRAALTDPDEMLDTATVTAAMALCTNDVCNGNMNIWNVHLDGVIRLLTAFLENQKATSRNDPFAQCLIKWCITMDILAGFSRLRTVQDGLLASFPTESIDLIDDISGFSLRLAPLLAQMPHLVQRHRLLTTENLSFSGEISAEAEILEAKISDLLDAEVSEKTISNVGELSTELRSTHLAFVHAALLYFHRRIQSLPRNHFKVRSDIRSIIQSCEQIGEISSANILILWPIFTAGCETEIISEREYIQSRMRKMQNLGMGNYTRARESLYSFWASKTSLPWDVYFSSLGKELVLF